MRTNIVIDDALMRDALALSKLRTKREVVHQALEEFVRNLKRKHLGELKGKIRFAPGYDYKALRKR